MSKVCQVTGKRPVTGNNVSHAHNKTRRRFLPNLHTHRFWVEAEKRWVRLRVSSKGMRIIDKLGIAAVLADNISGLLKSERVAPFTREDLFEPTHRVIVDITRFDGQLDKEIILDVVWSIKKITDNKPLVMRRSFVRETVSSPTYDDFVAAQSKALATLSKEIVDSLKKMSNP